MTDIVDTTGRPMSKALEHALDNITGSTRRGAIEAFTHTATSGPVAALHAAIALELRLCQLREDDALRSLHEALQEPDTRPYPQATGEAWWPTDDGTT